MVSSSFPALAIWPRALRFQWSTLSSTQASQGQLAQEEGFQEPVSFTQQDVGRERVESMRIELYV